jgi:hypothetical protein
MIWKEVTTIGSHPTAVIYEDEETDRMEVKRFAQEIRVKSVAWFDPKTATLRIDLEAIEARLYEYAHTLHTWDAFGPSRYFKVMECDTLAKVYREVIQEVDTYIRRVTRVYRDLADDVSGLTDAEILASWENQLDLSRQAAESGGQTPWKDKDL